MGPYSEQEIVVTFAPRLKERKLGFKSTSSMQQDFEDLQCNMIVDIVETEQRVEFRTSGRALIPKIALSQHSFRFGECAVNEKVDQLVTITNKNDRKEITFGVWSALPLQFHPIQFVGRVDLTARIPFPPFCCRIPQGRSLSGRPTFREASPYAVQECPLILCTKSGGPPCPLQLVFVVLQGASLCLSFSFSVLSCSGTQLYVCMCVYVKCVCVCRHLWTCACLFVKMPVCKNVCMCVYMYVRVHVFCICMKVCMCECIHVCMLEYMYVCVYEKVCLYCVCVPIERFFWGKVEQLCTVSPSFPPRHMCFWLFSFSLFLQMGRHSGIMELLVGGGAASLPLRVSGVSSVCAHV